MQFANPHVVHPLLCLVLHHHYRGAAIPIGAGHRAQCFLGVLHRLVSDAC
jgi:hypothetical protein